MDNMTEEDVARSLMMLEQMNASVRTNNKSTILEAAPSSHEEDEADIHPILSSLLQ